MKQFRGTLDDQLRVAAETISQQLDAYPGEFIGVMCPRKEDVEPIAEYLQRQFGDQVMVQVSGKYEYFESSAPIVCNRCTKPIWRVVLRPSKRGYAQAVHG